MDLISFMYLTRYYPKVTCVYVCMTMLGDCMYFMYFISEGFHCLEFNLRVGLPNAATSDKDLI